MTRRTRSYNGPMPHVLIVDDEPNSAEMLATVVRGEGFTTAVAGSLREARQQLVMMPAQVLAQQVTNSQENSSTHKAEWI